MKRSCIAALLALLLVLLPCAAIHAETPAGRVAQAFVDLLTEMDVACTHHPAEDDGSELVTVDLMDDSISLAYTVHIRFDAAGTSVRLSVPAILSFDESHRDSVLLACNRLNSTYMYTRFIADVTERTVTPSIDLLLGSQAVSDVVLEAFERLLFILPEAYPALAPYAI